MSDVRQCPECELRFGSDWELKEHLAVEHPDEPDVAAADDDRHLEEPWRP